MSKRRRARPAPAPVQPEASWDYRTGHSDSGGSMSRIFDGSKFSGALMYPSATDLDYSALRLRSRLATWESTQGKALIQRLVDNTVGSGLQLQSSPIWELINNPRLKDDEAREQYTREIELRFWLWANSPEASADGRLTLQEMQSFAFVNQLRDGESCHVLRYNDRKDRISPLSIQHIDPEQIETPLGKAAETDAKIRGYRIKDGIEVNAAGEQIAIHVRDPETRNYTRITTWGGAGAGRRWVLHPIISDLVGAVRGTPLLAPLVHELEKLTDYTVAEIQAAVLNAVIAGYVTTEVDGEKRNPLMGIQSRTGNSSTDASTYGEPKRSTIDSAGIWLQNLGKGQDVKSFDTKRPNVNFEGFVKSVTKMLSASVSIPVEVLEMSFNANYSASRASLILFWKTVMRWRDFLVSQFLRPIYEAWFAEEIRAGRLGEVTGWDDPIIRAAWLNATWDGDSLPSIDPVKDAEADDLRLAQGSTTREAVARKYNGSDFRANAQRLKEENALIKDAGGGPKEPAQPAPPAENEETPPGGEEP